MKYLLKVLFEAVVLVLIVGVVLWLLITYVLPDYIG